MLSSADLLADLGVDGVKLHHLHVIRGTPMELELRRGAVVPLGFPEYRELAIRYLERLPPETVVFRLFGEAPDEMLVAPRWAESPPEARRLIEDEMRARGTAQGAARRGAASARP
jgi:radical SAM superfamily enzyme